MKWLSVPLVVVALVAGVIFWIYPRDGELSPMTVQRQGRPGIVEIHRGGEVIEVVDRASIQPGDLVHTSRDARAKLRLEGDRRVWLAGAADVRITGGAALEAVGGSVVAEVGEKTIVSFEEVSARSASGVFRVDRNSASGRAGSYRGTVSVSGPGQEPVTVARFFQISVAAGRISAEEPYRVDAHDSWDRVWLKDVLVLDRRLERLASAAAARVGPRGGLIDRFRPLRRGFLEAYAHHRARDLIVGYSVAQGTPRVGVRAAFRRAFGLFDAGGAWGLVATILDARERAVVAQLGRAVLGLAPGTRAGGAVAAGGGAGTATGSPGGEPAALGGDAPAGAPAGNGGGPTGSGDDGSQDSGGGDGGGGDDGDGGDGGGGGGGGGDECANEIDCILPPLPIPTPSL